MSGRGAFGGTTPSEFGITSEKDLIMRMFPGKPSMSDVVVNRGDWVSKKHNVSLEGQILSEFQAHVLPVPAREIVVGFHFIAETLADRASRCTRNGWGRGT